MGQHSCTFTVAHINTSSFCAWSTEAVKARPTAAVCMAATVCCVTQSKSKQSVQHTCCNDNSQDPIAIIGSSLKHSGGREQGVATSFVSHIIGCVICRALPLLYWHGFATQVCLIADARACKPVQRHGQCKRVQKQGWELGGSRR